MGGAGQSGVGIAVIVGAAVLAVVAVIIVLVLRKGRK